MARRMALLFFLLIAACLCGVGVLFFFDPLFVLRRWTWMWLGLVIGAFSIVYVHLAGRRAQEKLHDASMFPEIIAAFTIVPVVIIGIFVRFNSLDLVYHIPIPFEVRTVLSLINILFGTGVVWAALEWSTESKRIYKESPGWW